MYLDGILLLADNPCVSPREYKLVSAKLFRKRLRNSPRHPWLGILQMTYSRNPYT